MCTDLMGVLMDSLENSQSVSVYLVCNYHSKVSSIRVVEPSAESEVLSLYGKKKFSFCI